MSWSSRLRHPLEIGNGSVLRTLADARDFIQSLPLGERMRPQWHSLATLLPSAANSANASLIALVTDRLREELARYDLGKKPAAGALRRPAGKRQASAK